MVRHNNRAWVLLSPAVAVMIFVGIVPLLTAFNYSFFDIFTIQQAFWIGEGWYRNILSSAQFYASLARSFLFSLLAMAIQFPLGIAIAKFIVLHPRLKLPALILVAMPLVVPWNMIAIMWHNLVDPRMGLLGSAFSAIGFAFDYKFNALHTWSLLLVMDSWHWVGLVVILAYAGFSSIHPAYYQAAAIDGATRWAIFRYIELPKISTALSIAFLLRFVDSLMINTEAFAINAGGPFNATTFLSLDLSEDIKAFNYGSAAARSMLSCLIVITVVWAFRFFSDRQREAV